MRPPPGLLERFTISIAHIALSGPEVKLLDKSGGLVERSHLLMEPSIIALLTDALEDRPLEAVAEWCAARGIGGLELGVGGYSPAPHVDALRAGADLAGLDVVALNASGNPLHPDH